VGCDNGGSRRPPPAADEPVPRGQPAAPTIASTIDHGVRHRRRPYRDYDDDQDSFDEDLSAINDRLDDLARQIERIARRRPGEDRNTLNSLAETIAHFDRRLDRIVTSERPAASTTDSRTRNEQPSAAPKWLPAFDQTIAEISARQRASDVAPASPTAPTASTRAAPAEHAQNLTGLEQQLRHITEQIATLQRPCRLDDMTTTLRGDLAELGRSLTEAMPRQAVEMLQQETRALVERVDRSQNSAADGGKLAQLERGLAEVRDALCNLMPAENLVAVNETVKSLAHKIDRIAAIHQDPIALQQLDQSIAALRNTVSHAASNDTVGKLADEVRSIEDHIVKLTEKLDASDTWLKRLDAIERGIADLSVHLDDLRKNKPDDRRQGIVSHTTATTSHPPAQASVPSLRAPSSATAMVVTAAPSLLASPPLAPSIAQATSFVAAASTSAPAVKVAAPCSPARQPIDPHLPPDTPIEPSSSTSPARFSAANRIAASEAALGSAKPSIPETSSLSSSLAAARRAARAADAEMPPASTPQIKPATVAHSAAPLGQRWTGYFRALLVATSVVIIVLGVLWVAVDLWQPSNLPELPTPAIGQPDTQPDSDNAQPDPNMERRTMPAPGVDIHPDSPIENPPAGAPSDDSSSIADPAGSAARKTNPNSTATPPYSTGSIVRQESGLNTTHTPPTLPASIGGPLLRTAAANGNPAAEYEIAVRYAEGRGITQNLEEAARWLERAANAGFAPAQFRLGSLYDKGGGLKKNRVAAQRLYAAAAEKGHAKAMHNLAVLYAEGFDGKPNYRLAAQWFRKAADYGITDSQYNLAILYIRGVGVEQNLAESYKWLTLAANQGDQEAEKKRDEVAERLDQETLTAMHLAVRTFSVKQQPEEAASLRIPLGGWDRTNTAAQPARPRPRSFGSDASAPNSVPAPAPAPL
jgi:localization factor PodJL